MTSAELFNELKKTKQDFTDQIRSYSDDQINAIPFENSWTIGQLFEHVTKSNLGVAKMMLKPFPLTERNPEEFAEKFRSIFLSTDNRFDAPDFIVPGNGPFNKEKIVEDMNTSFSTFIENASHTNLNEETSGMPFGPATKLEVVYFVLYHSQRHLRQLTKICKELSA
jgi:hypothetical protein